MTVQHRALACGCAYELRPNKDSLIAFSSDIVWWCTNECDAANELLSKWRDEANEDALESYYDHVWSGLVTVEEE